MYTKYAIVNEKYTDIEYVETLVNAVYGNKQAEIRVFFLKKKKSFFIKKPTLPKHKTSCSLLLHGGHP